MTAEEKAKTLVEEFYNTSRIAMSGAFTIFRGTAKASAIQCCYEVIFQISSLNSLPHWSIYEEAQEKIRFWKKVIEEIKKL